MNLGYKSADQTGSYDEKNRDKKSYTSIPLIGFGIFTSTCCESGYTTLKYFCTPDQTVALRGNIGTKFILNPAGPKYQFVKGNKLSPETVHITAEGLLYVCFTRFSGI
jgi:hypothetical protein